MSPRTEATLVFPLEIRDRALSDASRGCLWYAGANLTVVNSSFSGFTKHALVLVSQNGALSIFGVKLFDVAENAILIQSGGAQSHLLSGRYAAASHRPSS